MNDNSGISISGGTVHVGAMAAGQDARASNTVAPAADDPLAELRMQMATLVEQVRLQAHLLHNGPQVIALAESASRELDTPRPDPRSFGSVLRSLAATVGSVASLTGSVEALQHAAAALL